MMQTIAASGGGMAAASSVHMNIFGLHPVVVFGTQEQQQRWLPPLIAGEHKACFGVTEPNAGLNTLKLKTRAVRDGDHYVVHGQKIWISTAQVAHKILLLARTTPVEEVREPRGGLSLFYTDLDRSDRAGARDREARAQGGRLERTVHRRPAHPGRGSHRRGGQGLRLHPARHESGAHPARRRGHRPGPRRATRARPGTPTSASSSTARSARTRASSIRSPSAGWNSRPRTR